MLNLLIFGTGAVSDIVSDYYLDIAEARILAFVNSIGEMREKRGIKVISLDEITEYTYDYILIAAGAFDEICEQCVRVGVPREKIIGIIQYDSKKLEKILVKTNKDISEAFNTNGGGCKNLPDFHMFSYYIANELFLNRYNIANTPRTVDTVRLHTLYGLAREIEINQVLGSVAELGVYKGDFACILNQVFPHRNLYLFDTFGGFSDADVIFDKENNYSKNSSLFQDTSVEIVMSKMANRDKCKIFKGYFPESAVEVDDIFSFVSLDADLFMPTYNGLLFFYERLSRNGYILVHDFNNRYYSGAREAVVKFCKEKGIGYCPIPDYLGSVIIGK